MPIKSNLASGLISPRSSFVKNDGLMFLALAM
ncbi:hypothetical protein K034_3941, partial [Acinetobacter baumannii 42057_3]